MLISLVLTCLTTLVIATAALLSVGHRVRVSAIWLSVTTVICSAVAGGEVAARLFLLPAGHVLVAEAVLVIVGIGVALLRRRWNPVGVAFFAALITAAASYLALAAYVTVAGGLSIPAALASAVVLVLETLALALAASFAFETCDVACRTGPDRELATADPAHLPFVSLHVAAYNEPPEMLIETIQSLEAIDYPYLEIVVVDNNTTDEEVWRPVQAYCAEREKVTFVHVEPWPGFKSGALNLALGVHTDPRAELVGVVDADYLVRPDYLRRCVGYFADPDLAFLQTPQDYRDWEGDTYLTACYDAYRYFFASSMPSRNQRNSIIFGGTMGLIRRDVLGGLGGWDEWCITEDAEVSLRMLRAGHSGLYLHESFGHGIMPLTFTALKRQRFRWCFGGIQILRKHWRSLVPWDSAVDNRLSLVQRTDYLLGGLQWFTDFVTLGFTAVLAVSAALVMAGQPLLFRPFAGPALLLPVVIATTGLLRAMWALRHLTGITTRRALLAFTNWMALSWTVGLACAKGLVRSEGVFLRTPKWKGERGLVEALRETRVETLLAGGLWASAAGLVAAQEGGAVLPALALWQGGVYAASPMMAWLNLHTELSARLERRRRGEDRRERLAVIQPHVARAGLGVSVLGLVGLFVVGGVTAGDKGGVPGVPRRTPNDAGPLGNLGVLPGVDRREDGPGAPVDTTTSTTTIRATTAPVAPSTTATRATSQPGPTTSTTTVTTAPTATATTATTTATTLPPSATSTAPPATGPPTTTASPSSGPPTTTSPPSSGPPTSRPVRP